MLISFPPGSALENQPSYGASVSADGRYIAFASSAANLVSGDTNDATDVFVFDRSDRSLVRVSLTSSGGEAPYAGAHSPAISADGRRVAFLSRDNLTGTETSWGYTDVYLRDRDAQTTIRVSDGPAGAGGDYFSEAPVISPDGRYVAYSTAAHNLVPGVDTAGQVLVYDVARGSTGVASVSSTGAVGNGISAVGSLSENGRYIGFGSSASNLAGGDTNGETDAFIHDFEAGTTQRVSLASGGGEANGSSGSAHLSADGRYAAFTSLASNLAGEPPLCNATIGARCREIYVHDRVMGTTTAESVAPDGTFGNDNSGEPVISADGRLIAFATYAWNIASGANCGNCSKVVVRDRSLGKTTAVSVMPSGEAPADSSDQPSISADGRFIAFESYAALTPEDTNVCVVGSRVTSCLDIYLHDVTAAPDSPPSSPPPAAPPPPSSLPPPTPPPSREAVPLPPAPRAKCRVPRVVGTPASRAVVAIRRAHCRVGAVSTRWSERVRRGYVIAQRPRPGLRIRRGSRVRLVVSRGRH